MAPRKPDHVSTQNARDANGEQRGSLPHNRSRRLGAAVTVLLAAPCVTSCITCPRHHRALSREIGAYVLGPYVLGARSSSSSATRGELTADADAANAPPRKPPPSAPALGMAPV